MLTIGISGDLINSDGRPIHPAVDFSTELHNRNVKVQRVQMSSDRLVVPTTTDQVDILVLGDCGVDRGEILSGRRTRMVCRFGKGHDDIDVNAASAKGILVTRVVQAGEDSMATGVIALVLALATQLLKRRTIVMDPSGDWDAPLAHGAVGLKGKTLGIVGYGRIGRAVATRARCFGMTIAYYDPLASVADLPGDRRVGLDELMRTADFISVNCPLNTTTRGLISSEMLNLMRPGSYLVNTGRGAVVDETALYDALRSGHLGGAALDVFATEPLPPDSPLRAVPNLLLTPHAVGVSDEMYAEYMQSVAASIKELLDGRCPHDALNPEVFRPL
ncbi:2-hydroxyacid dehydrogenase [Aestuariivirga sp.]|uniref:2-hydroxyacid dehydrogenase n=1 Tax=Aestuariivirga sp. TaxID=2650926 RepID=UPI003BAA8FD9